MPIPKLQSDWVGGGGPRKLCFKTNTSGDVEDPTVRSTRPQVSGKNGNRKGPSRNAQELPRSPGALPHCQDTASLETQPAREQVSSGLLCPKLLNRDAFNEGDPRTITGVPQADTCEQSKTDRDSAGDLIDHQLQTGNFTCRGQDEAISG